MPKNVMSAGFHVNILSVGSDPANDERYVNSRLAALADDAHGAGFKLDVKSVGYSQVHGVSRDTSRVIILYELSEDPLFRPPM